MNKTVNTQNNTSKPKSRKEESIQQRSSTLLDSNTPFTIVESYKAARTNIIFALGSPKGCKKIIVTSANPGEGKTTTTLNLAIAFAQMDARVLVIDGDLRKPRIYRHLQLERKGGLSDILCGMIEIEDAIHHCEAQKIDCITSGQIPPNPAELLSSEAMGALLDKLSENYDYIFIDTPPVTVVTEAAVMARFVDGVIIVARQNYTIHESLMKARENLLFAEAKILGYILNDVSTGRYGYGRYYYRGYSSYNYEYGYSYGDTSYSYGNKYGYRYGGRYGNKYGYSYQYGKKSGYSYGKKPEIGVENTQQSKEEKNAEKKVSIIEKLRDFIRQKR